MRCIQSILRYIFSGKCLKMYFKFIKKGDTFLRTRTFSLQCLQIRNYWFVNIFFVRDFNRVIISWNNGKPIIHEKWHKRTVSSYVEMMWLYWSCFWVFWDHFRSPFNKSISTLPWNAFTITKIDHLLGKITRRRWTFFVSVV